jgi:hypothetical protein
MVIPRSIFKQLVYAQDLFKVFMLRLRVVSSPRVHTIACIHILVFSLAGRFLRPSQGRVSSCTTHQKKYITPQALIGNTNWVMDTALYLPVTTVRYPAARYTLRVRESHRRRPPQSHWCIHEGTCSSARCRFAVDRCGTRCRECVPTILSKLRT